MANKMIGKLADREVREYLALIARAVPCDNGVKVELGKSINGSGPKAFGGCKEWPCLRITVPFQEGEEDKMRTVANCIEGLLARHGVIIRRGSQREKDVATDNTCKTCGRPIIYGAECSDYALKPKSPEDTVQRCQYEGCNNPVYFGSVCMSCHEEDKKQ